MSKNAAICMVLLFLLNSCGQKKDEMNHKYTNALIDETSPYLLQHAHNPVNWEAWHPEVLERAKKEDKLLLISIGYAACHWCHVMERECFEDEEVAKMMNDNFVNIKIDREERPDVDQIYMDAIQMMTGNGGWPLNIVALPDGRPFWGATYLPKEDWTKALNRLLELRKENPNKITEYASNLKRGIQAVNLIENKGDSESYSLEQLDNTVNSWSSHFDTYLGGYKRAPKFMMPNNLDFLMHYGTSEKNEELLDYVNTSLTRMAYGGVFDHLGGGFSRYSVDTKWHVPHFEKMLYDNGPLTSLYAKAYAVTKNPLYKNVVEETIAFVLEELTDESGGFYSALDADSLNEKGELEEGAYYVWTKEELQSLLGTDFEVFKDYYNINSYGEWEENYVLIRDKSDQEIAEKHAISEDELKQKISKSVKILKEERDRRPKPRLDDKILTSWNGLMLKGFIDAYRYLENDDYLAIALKNAEFIKREMVQEDGSLHRNYKNGKSNIDGFLEDYASIIEAYIALYEVTFDQKWLDDAKKLLDYAIIHFYDKETGLFFFTSDEDNLLIRRSVETIDKEISSSNSVMANNLLKLHKLYMEENYGEVAERMVKNVQENFMEYGQSYANWLHLVLYQNLNFYEIAVVGDDYQKIGKQISKKYLPNSILVGSQKEGAIELLKSRYNEGQTLVFVCIEGTCKLPVTSAEQALGQL